MSKLDEYKTQYFTIEAIETGLTAKLTRAQAFYGSCQYRINNGAWQTLTNNVATQSINAGQTISFKGNLRSEIYNGAGQYIGIGTFTISKKCNLKGNINSLYIGDNVTNKDYNYSASPLQPGIFSSLFKNCSTIIDASCLVLPSTNLSGLASYFGMFESCTGMINSIEELPATTLGVNCYYGMFANCNSLVNTIKTLPATVLPESCYRSMFYGCTSLTTAPNINATAVSTSSCASMFTNCINLINVQPVLNATIFGDEEKNQQASGCYEGMFSGCTSLTTAPELPATKISARCYMAMFSGCTSLTTPPSILPAKDLTDTLENEYTSYPDYNNPPWHATACYRLMFSDCTSLTTAPELPAAELSASCYEEMFFGCYNLKYAPELPADKLRQNCYIGMFENCINLSRIKFCATKLIYYTNPSQKDGYINVPIKNLDSYLYYDGIAPITEYLGDWTYNVGSSGSFYIQHDIILPSGVHGIPRGWTRVNDNYKIATKKYMNSNVRKGLWWNDTNRCVTASMCTGIDLVSLNTSLTPNPSVTDTSGTPWVRLVKCDALSRNQDNVTIYFGIWNDKSSNAKLDLIDVEISTSSDASSGTWTDISSNKNQTPGTVAAIYTGTVPFTIPSTYNLATTQYYIRILCGDTDKPQDWSYTWGNSSNIKNLTYGSTSKVQRKYTNAIPLQRTSSTGDSILMDGEHFGGNYGRSNLKAACFKIK